MKLRLTKTARITHKAGDIVEVSPAEANFLLSTGSAEICAVETETVTVKKTTRSKSK